MLDELEQDTAGRVRVQERHLVAPGTRPRPLDRVDAAGARLLQRRLDVVCRHREVVDTRAVLVEILCDRPAITRFQQFEVPPAQVEETD